MTGNDFSKCALDALKTVDIFLSGAKKETERRLSESRPGKKRLIWPYHQ